jgi:hypothetical protein
MSDPVLLLGPIVFQEFEVPSNINFGGRQRLALHHRPGGGRIIDALGRDDAQITFSGVFSGSNATLRARSIDELRAAGLVLPLTWDVFFYSVVIADFHANYRNSCWIPYLINCSVLRDEASALVQLPISLATAALADIANAQNAGFDLSPTQAALGVPCATVRGTAAYGAARSSLSAAQSSIESAIDTADTALAGVNLAGVNSPNVGAARLLEATAIAGQLGSLTTARSYVARAAVNLTNAST